MADSDLKPIAIKMRQLMAKYYKDAKLGKYKFKKIAWITSGGPVEPLISMGIIPVYPENHGAMIGARKMGAELSDVAESLGYSRDLCSYFRADVGHVVAQKSPIPGMSFIAKPGLPRPHLLVLCNNICGTVTKWYEVQARYFNVPLVFLDTPYNFDGPLDHLVDYVQEQFEEIIPQIEKATGRKWNLDKFIKTAEIAQEGIQLWSQVLHTCESSPSPMSCFDAFFFLAPIVTLRGDQVVVDFYKELIDVLQKMVDEKKGAIPNEKYRLVWDNLPIWYRVRKLSKTFAKYDCCLVADTYTNAWADNEIAADDPMRSMARGYSTIFLNRNIESKIQNFCKLIDQYNANGFVMHSNRSCKPYSFGQYDIKDEVQRRTGLPGLIIEADMTDERSYADEQIDNRIQAFAETLQERN